MILLPYRFCGDSHHAFAFPFVLIFLPLRLSCKESSTSNQAFSIVFTTLSVPLTGDRNLRRKDVTALPGARNRYALRLADHQRSSPCFAGWDRQDIINLLISYDSDSSTDNGCIPCSTSNLTSLALDLRKESVSKEIL